MKIAIQQPYLFPYRGYFDLIKAVDKFVIYDDAKYIKGGWINRNYFPELFTFRLRKHSDYAKINECYFYDIEADKKYFKRKTGINADRYLDELIQEYNLAWNCSRTLRRICDDLGIKTEFYFSSDYEHGKSIQGVLDLVREFNGDTYINLPGGKSLYNQKQFGDIKLEFIETEPGSSILCSKELGL